MPAILLQALRTAPLGSCRGALRTKYDVGGGGRQYCMRRVRVRLR